MATSRDDRSFKDERSFGRLFADLSNESTSLVRNEIALAKAEISEKVTQVGVALAALAAGGLVLFAGFLVLLDAAVFGLSKILEPYGWPALAALIVAVATMVVGLIILMIGKSSLKPENLSPRRTTESLRRDTNMVKEQVR